MNFCRNEFLEFLPICFLTQEYECYGPVRSKFCLLTIILLKFLKTNYCISIKLLKFLKFIYSLTRKIFNSEITIFNRQNFDQKMILTNASSSCLAVYSVTDDSTLCGARMRMLLSLLAQVRNMTASNGGNSQLRCSQRPAISTANRGKIVRQSQCQCPKWLLLWNAEPAKRKNEQGPKPLPSPWG